MSENKSQPKDRTALYIAIVGAVATIAAAFIGVLPNLLKSATPTPIILTATPLAVPTQQPTLAALLTATAPPTTIPPTAIAQATETAPLSAASATPLPPSPTRSRTVTFLLVNNLPRAMEFFVDGTSATKINSGAYQPLRVPRGNHELKQCVLGTDYNAPENCFAKKYDVAADPDVWEMFDANHPVITGANSVLLVLNRAQTAQDIFIDAEFQDTVAAGAYKAFTVTNSMHSIQTCAPGYKPPGSACSQPLQDDYRFPTHYYVIRGEAS